MQHLSSNTIYHIYDKDITCGIAVVISVSINISKFEISKPFYRRNNNGISHWNAISKYVHNGTSLENFHILANSTFRRNNCRLMITVNIYF